MPVRRQHQTARWEDVVVGVARGRDRDGDQHPVNDDECDDDITCTVLAVVMIVDRREAESLSGSK